MNKPISIVLLFLLVFYCSCYAQQNSNEVGPQSGHPNIIFIFIDDLGYGDLSSYGNEKLEIPNMDKLAEEGIKFTDFYAASPICSPSRVSVLTGRIPPAGAFIPILTNGKRMKSVVWPIFWIRKPLRLQGR